MSLTLKPTSSVALIPALTSSLAQLQPTILQTQESIQGLVGKVTSALESSEERGRKLEAELIAEKGQHAAEKATYEQRLKAQEALIDTMQKMMGVMQKQTHEQAAQITELQKDHIALIQRYNTHVHSHCGEGNGLGTMQTSTPGIKKYAGRQGYIFTSHAFPEPKFDEKKGS